MPARVITVTLMALLFPCMSCMCPGDGMSRGCMPRRGDSDACWRARPAPLFRRRHRRRRGARDPLCLRGGGRGGGSGFESDAQDRPLPGPVSSGGCDMLADGADAAPDLVDMCARYIQASASSSGGAGWASCHTAAEMCELVVGVLRQPVCSESELLDLLGYDALDFIEWLIAHRDELVARAEHTEPATHVGAGLPQGPPAAGATSSAPAPAVPSTPSVRTRVTPSGGRARVDATPSATAWPAVDAQGKVPGVGASAAAAGPEGEGEGEGVGVGAAVEWIHDPVLKTTEAVLPPPASQRARGVSTAGLVPVAAFGEEFEGVFPPRITHLNAMQSAVFARAFKSSINLLVLAPTGAIYPYLYLYICINIYIYIYISQSRYLQ